jgi:hypothetical protein
MRMNRASLVLVAASVGIMACAGGFARSQEHVAKRGDSFIAGPPPAIARLVEELKRNPAKPSNGAERLGLYLMDVTSGEATLIADEPDPGLTQCGSPAWSGDGKIYFDATPGTQWNLTRLKRLELVEGKLKLTDIGPGNCPTPSPTGDRVMFLLNGGAVPGAEAGVWLMNADGSERRKLGGYGRPFWSPDGHQFLVVSFSSPREVTVIDDRAGHNSGVLQIPDNKIFTMPGWAGEETIVAIIGADEPDTIASLDISNPQDARIKKVLWKRPADMDLKLNYPAYSPFARRYMFVGGNDKGMAIYSIDPEKPGPPKRLGPESNDKHISGLVLSLDGRYLLFSSDRTTRQ